MSKIKDRIEINANAVALRKQFGEDPHAPIDIFASLGDSDALTIVFYPMSVNISGMCLRGPDFKMIAINSALSYGRQRFTAAHELCHLFFHDDLPSMVICSANLDEAKKPMLEKEADIFASFFLAPYEALYSYIRDRLNKGKHGLDVYDIIRIEQYFGLSHQAALWRLVNDGYLSVEEAETMKPGVKSQARRMGYDDSLYCPTPPDRQRRTLGEYVKTAVALQEKGLISNGRYEELLMDAFRADIVYGLDIEGDFSND